MTKKTAKKKKAAKRVPAPKRTAKKAPSKSTKAEKVARRQTRQPLLPGAEGARYVDLDGICESIASIRARKNKAIRDEKEELADALPAMRAHRVVQYRHAGIELVRKVGAEKLSVREVEDASDASAAEVTDEQLDQVDARYDAEDAADGDEGSDFAA
jgi:hypothetical protein